MKVGGGSGKVVRPGTLRRAGEFVEAITELENALGMNVTHLTLASARYAWSKPAERFTFRRRANGDRETHPLVLTDIEPA